MASVISIGVVLNGSCEAATTFGSSLKIEWDLLGRFFVRRIPHLRGPLFWDGYPVY